MAVWKTSWVKKLIDGVSTKTFAISHVKSTYYDYKNNKMLNTKLDEIDEQMLEMEDVGEEILTEPDIPPVITEKFSELSEQKLDKPTVTPITIKASGWTGNAAPYVYDLGVSAEYDFKITFSRTMTTNVFEEIQLAALATCEDDNLLRAWGDKPTIDIPAYLRKWVR